MLPENLLNLLDAWTERGWLRALDRAFVSFLSEQHPDTPDLVLLAVALTSHQLGRGHICLDLDATLNDPDGALSLPPEGEVGEELPFKPSELLSEVTQSLWEESLLSSPLVTKADGNTPLVLSAGRLYLRRYWQHTQLVAQGVLKRVEKELPTPKDLSTMLDQLFSTLRSPEEAGKKEIHWQSVAAAIASKSALSVISGGPGTGKTTTVVQLLGLLQGLALADNHKLRIRLAAPTGKAAARLTESIGKAIHKLPETVREHMPTEVTTLHRLLGSRPDTRHFVHNHLNQLHVDLLVIDEASMVDLEMMSALLSALPDHARLILLGDKDQLASVEAGSVLGDLCHNAEKPGYRPETIAWVTKNSGYLLNPFEGDGTDLDQHIVVLRKSHRFGENSGIGALARAVKEGNSAKVNAVWKNGFSDITQLKLKTTDDKAFARLVLNGEPDAFSHKEKENGPTGYEAYLQRLGAGRQANETEEEWLRGILKTFDRFQLLSALRKGDWGVEGLNQKAAYILHKKGLITARDGWYPGRPVLVTRNDYSLGLMNGDIGILLPVTDGKTTGSTGLRVVCPMADGSLKKVLPSRLSNVETVFAMTVHKSQGSEFDHTALILPDTMNPVLTRELVYTGITRAKSWFTLASPRMDLFAETVKRRTHRASGLADLFG